MIYCLWVGLEGRLPPLTGLVREAFFSTSWISRFSGAMAVGWSLAVEEWFYLLLPAIICVAAACGIRRLRVAYFIAAAVLAGSSILLRAGAHPQSWDLDIRKVAFFRFDSIAAGMVLAALYSNRLPFWATPSRLALVSGLGFAACAVFIFRILYLPEGYFSDVIFPVFTALPALGFILWAKDRSYPKRLAQFFVLTSRLTYSIYLTHGFVLLATLNIPGSLLRLGTRWLLFGPVAWVTWRFIELPFMRLRDKISG